MELVLPQQVLPPLFPRVSVPEFLRSCGTHPLTVYYLTLPFRYRSTTFARHTADVNCGGPFGCDCYIHLRFGWLVGLWCSFYLCLLYLYLTLLPSVHCSRWIPYIPHCRFYHHLLVLTPRDTYWTVRFRLDHRLQTPALPLFSSPRFPRPSPDLALDLRSFPREFITVLERSTHGCLLRWHWIMRLVFPAHALPPEGLLPAP